MALTKRFQLNKFGAADGGSIADDGYKFSERDRDTIDAILSAFEAHTHSGGDRLADPSAAPTLSLLTEGGALPGGRTYYYRVSFLDRYGLETAASAESVISTPSQVQPPGPPVLTALSTAGAVLTEGLYQYALTAISGDYETQLGTIAVITLMSDRNSISLAMPALPTGATAFGVWRQGPNAVGFTRIGQTSASTILDDGSVPDDPCACDPENLPPQENRTSSTNIVTITAPTFPADARRWRVYRSLVSGSFGSETLVAEIVDVDANGNLVNFYMDDGDQLLYGRPLEISQTLVPTAAVAGSAGGSGVVYLEAPDATTWRISATRTGEIITSLSGVPAGYAPSGMTLQDANGATWRVTVDATGVLTTTQTASVAGDVTYTGGSSPDLPTVDGRVTYKLTVTTLGELQTHGLDDSTVVEGIGVRRIVASPTQPADPQVGDLWIQTPA